MTDEASCLSALDDILDDMDINHVMEILAFNVASRFAAMYKQADPIRRPVMLAGVMAHFNAQIFEFIDEMWFPSDDASEAADHKVLQ